MTSFLNFVILCPDFPETEEDEGDYEYSQESSEEDGDNNNDDINQVSGQASAYSRSVMTDAFVHTVSPIAPPHVSQSAHPLPSSH